MLIKNMPKLYSSLVRLDDFQRDEKILLSNILKTIHFQIIHFSRLCKCAVSLSLVHWFTYQ